MGKDGLWLIKSVLVFEKKSRRSRLSGLLLKLLKLNLSFNNEWHLQNGGKLYIWRKKMEAVCSRKDQSLSYLHDTTIFNAGHLCLNQLCPTVNPTCFDMRSKLAFLLWKTLWHLLQSYHKYTSKNIWWFYVLDKIKKIYKLVSVFVACKALISNVHSTCFDPKKLHLHNTVVHFANKSILKVFPLFI